MNVAAVINSKKSKKPTPLNFKDLEDETELIIEENSRHGQQREDNQQEESSDDSVNIDMFEDDSDEEFEAGF